MSKLLAGVGCLALQPKIGTNLVGYAPIQETVGIHDPIHARALVIENDDTTIALCSIEVCFFLAQDVKQMRKLIGERCSILPENIMFFATHTHSAPAFYEPENWVKSPAETAADAVLQAYENRQPAKIGMGYGQLQGYSINRRFMDRPIDPSISVIRIDTADNKPMSVFGTYGNHAVVMGSDNTHVSGDWPGHSSLRLESEFGGDFVAIFGQGGAGDINPLTETVRQRLAAGHPIQAIGATSTMYGKYDPDDINSWDIEERAGGTFIEAETIAIAYNNEVMRVWRSIETTDEIDLWTERVYVNALPDENEVPIPNTPEIMQSRERFKRILADADENGLDIEIMMLGIGDALLVGQPGETFSENSVAFRKLCQQMGIKHPVLVSYANGWYSYLTPENAYVEGGYEVGVAQSMGLSRKLQNRIASAIQPILDTKATR